MNKHQIKAELRRSACEDNLPLYEMHEDAYQATWKLRIPTEQLGRISESDRRTFFLIIAEAL